MDGIFSLHSCFSCCSSGHYERYYFGLVPCTTTPRVPGKLLEFCDFRPGNWKTPGKTVVFLVLLEFSLNCR